MKLFERIARVVASLTNVEVKGYTPRGFVSFTPPFGPIRRLDFEPYDSEKMVVDGFKACSWVYSCSSWIAEQVSGVPWYVARIDKSGREAPAPGHELEQLLEYPNQVQSRKFMMQFQALQLMLRGNSLWRRITDNRGGGAELWPLNPASVEVIGSETSYIKAYRVTNKGQSERLDIPASDICHAQRPDPNNPLWGMPILRPLSKAISTDLDAVAWNKALINNMASPTGAFVDPNITTQEQWDEARARIDAHYSSPDNARKPLLLAGGAEYRQFGLSPAEMDFLESRKFSVTEICAAFGLLPALFSPDAATYSNLQVAVEWSWNNGAIPVLDSFADAFNTFFIRGRDRGNFVIRYDLSGVKALQKDLTTKAQAHSAYVSSGIPVNESIRLLGLPMVPVEGGDVPLINIGLIRLIDASSQIAPDPRKAEKEKV